MSADDDPLRPQAGTVPVGAAALPEGGRIDAADRRAARAALRRRREAIGEAGRAQRLPALCARLDTELGHRLRVHSDPVVAIYAALPGEPDLASRLSHWRARGWQVAVPVVVARDAPLRFARWDAQTAFAPAGFGVPEPVDPHWIDPTLLVVPCLGFDPAGWRIGYGGGFYDRTLAQRPCPAIGVGWDESEVSGFEPAPHDRRLDAVVTPTRTLGGGAS